MILLLPVLGMVYAALAWSMSWCMWVTTFSAAGASYSSPSTRSSSSWTSWLKVRRLGKMVMLLLAWPLRYISQKRSWPCQVAEHSCTGSAQWYGGSFSLAVPLRMVGRAVQKASTKATKQVLPKMAFKPRIAVRNNAFRLAKNTENMLQEYIFTAWGTLILWFTGVRTTLLVAPSTTVMIPVNPIAGVTQR